MRWLGSALIIMGGRRDPDPYRYDDEDRLRFVANSLTFNEVTDRIFDQLRSYFAADRNAALQMMQTIAIVRESVSSATRRKRLDEHADRLVTSVRLVPLTDYDQELLRAVGGRTSDVDDGKLDESTDRV